MTFRALRRSDLTTALMALAFAGAVASAASDPAHVAQLKSTKKCAGCDLSGADLRGADLKAADLKSANLQGAKLYKANLVAANLEFADLREADLRGANLRQANIPSFAGAVTDATTICPGGNAGPCQ
jgi:uncharacterized protein YjbI with pentapeptide repeats